MRVASVEVDMYNLRPKVREWERPCPLEIMLPSAREAMLQYAGACAGLPVEHNTTHSAAVADAAFEFASVAMPIAYALQPVWAAFLQRTPAPTSVHLTCVFGSVAGFDRGMWDQDLKEEHMARFYAMLRSVDIATLRLGCAREATPHGCWDGDALAEFIPEECMCREFVAIGGMRRDSLARVYNWPNLQRVELRGFEYVGDVTMFMEHVADGIIGARELCITELGDGADDEIVCDLSNAVGSPACLLESLSLSSDNTVMGDATLLEILVAILSLETPVCLKTMLVCKPSEKIIAGGWSAWHLRQYTRAASELGFDLEFVDGPL